MVFKGGDHNYHILLVGNVGLVALPKLWLKVGVYRVWVNYTHMSDIVGVG